VAIRCLPDGAGDRSAFVYQNARGDALAIVPIRMTDVSIRRLTFRYAELIGSSFDDVTSQIESSGWKGSEGAVTGLHANSTTSQRDLPSAVANGAEAPLAEIHWLKLNDRCIASQLWLRTGGMRAALQIGHIKEFSHVQPGHRWSSTSCVTPVPIPCFIR